MIERKLYKILTDELFTGKVIVLLGARQTGKTTLLKQILTNQPSVAWFDADFIENREIFTNVNVEKLRSVFADNKIIIIDEAQRIQDIGLKAKIIADNMKDIQLIVTGSSAFELSNNINEPLTGRKWEHRLFPISFGEMVTTNSLYDEMKSLHQRMLYGYYPEVVCNQDKPLLILNEIVNSYLYKDVLQWERIKRPDILVNLMKALAWQVGSEVSLNEISKLLGISKETVANYISILEKSQVIFRLSSYSRNMRTELRNKYKIYFYDNGVRNALINNFAGLDNRNDVGALWENFMISERLKYNSYSKNFTNMYFWRTTRQQEIDLIEEKDGILYAYEFKWNKDKTAKLTPSFKEAYPNHEFKVINPENYYEILIN